MAQKGPFPHLHISPNSEMNRTTLYRTVNPKAEATDVLVDTAQRQPSQRILKTLTLTPVFRLIVEFWKVSGVQLTTATQAITCLNGYLPQLNLHCQQQNKQFETKRINSKETTIRYVKKRESGRMRIMQAMWFAR